MGLGIGQRSIKSLLAEAPQRPAPSGTIQRRKTGFGVPIAKMDRPAAAISHLGMEARPLIAIASMSLVATLGLFRRMRGLNRAVSCDRTGSVRRIWRNRGVQSRFPDRTCRIAAM